MVEYYFQFNANCSLIAEDSFQKIKLFSVLMA